MSLEELKLNGWSDTQGKYLNPPNETEWIIYNNQQVFSGKSIIIPDWWSGLDHDIIIGKNLDSTCKSVGRSLVEWYSRFLLNLPEVPKCANPNCNNKVHIMDGKLSHGLSKTCCKSCGQSVSNIVRWNNPNDYLNQSYYRELKSNEMKSNLSGWNYDPEFQAKCKRGKIYDKSGFNYIFYVATTKSNKFKFGVYQEGSRNYRLYIQDEYNHDPYLEMIDLFISDNVTIANLEFELKSNLDWREYLELNESEKFYSLLNKIKQNYNLTNYNS